MSKNKIRSQDTVVVITGDDKGKRGVVLDVKPKLGLIRVNGIALALRHYKKKKDGEKSEIRIKERFIHISNVALVKKAS